MSSKALTLDELIALKPGTLVWFEGLWSEGIDHGAVEFVGVVYNSVDAAEVGMCKGRPVVATRAIEDAGREASHDGLVLWGPEYYSRLHLVDEPYCKVTEPKGPARLQLSIVGGTLQVELTRDDEVEQCS